jgi:hypothetical protein
LPARPCRLSALHSKPIEHYRKCRHSRIVYADAALGIDAGAADAVRLVVERREGTK